MMRFTASGVDDRRFLLVLAATFLLFALIIALHVNRFHVPESDFFDYRAKAVSLRNGHWPENFKRPPLYPALVALFSLPLPGRFRDLYAAEFIGYAGALFAFFLIWRISRRFIGQHAYWLVWLWALHPTTLRMAVKPKPEMFATALILWAFDLFLQHKKRAYLIAFLATLVRYEGALAIMAFGLSDVIFSKEKLKTIAHAFLAGIFIVLWTLFQGGGSDGAAYGNYFNTYHLNVGFLKEVWVGLIGFLPLAFFKIWFALIFSLFAVGAITFFNRFKREGFALILFIAGFSAMHIVWPFSNIDYVVIMAWSVFLFIFFGIMSIAHYARRSVKFTQIIGKLDNTFSASAAALLVFLFCAVWLTAHRFEYSQYNVTWSVVISFVFLGSLFYWLESRPVSFKNFAPVFWQTTFLLLLAFSLNSKANADFYDIRFSKAEFRLVGEWFEHNRQDGDKLAVDQPVIISYYTSADTEKDFVRLTDLPALPPQELHRWLKEHGVTHIAWLSSNRLQQSDEAWYLWKRDNRGWTTIAFLESGKDQSGFAMVSQLRAGPRWAHVYKI